MVKKAFNIFLMLVLVAQCFKSYSQEQDMKWAVKASYSLLWYSGEFESQYFNFSERNDGASVTFLRYMNPSFDLQFGLDYNQLNLSGEIDTVAGYSSGNMFSPLVQLNYKFNNGYLLPVDGKLRPYFGLGFNYWIGRAEGVGCENRYNNTGDTYYKGTEFSHFIDEVAFNTVLGVKYQFTGRLAAFIEVNRLFATTEELDGTALDMKNDNYGGGKIGVIINISKSTDRDGDGIPDKEDDCPDIPGLPEFNGCPDRDNDGIPDKDDDCPDNPGLPEYNGCPDRDGDGIIDKNDDCPDLPGIPEYNGCPDTDGDGVIDPNDLCPDTQSGVIVDEYGCPLDSDGDGLSDNVDQCPDEYGPLEYMGCPEPPDVGWPKSEYDTPPEVYFETDKYELSPEAEDELMKVVEFMMENPMMNIRLYGSADPRGTKEYNAVLSARRVAAVKKFFMRKGVPENRIMVKALGETQEVNISKDEENLTEDQRLRKFRKVLFETFFFMR